MDYLNTVKVLLYFSNLKLHFFLCLNIVNCFLYEIYTVIFCIVLLFEDLLQLSSYTEDNINKTSFTSTVLLQENEVIKNFHRAIQSNNVVCSDFNYVKFY